MSSKLLEKLDSTEKEKFYSKGNVFSCPDCRNLLTQGPCGGLCVNYYCYHCGSRFNESPFNIERINNKHNAPDKVVNFAAQFNLDKLKFTLNWLTTRAEKEEKECLLKRDVDGANKALDRINFWTNLATKKYGVSL